MPFVALRDLPREPRRLSRPYRHALVDASKVHTGHSCKSGAIPCVSHRSPMLDERDRVFTELGRVRAIALADHEAMA